MDLPYKRRDEYEVDVEAIHIEAPGTFWVFYLVASAEGLDKVNTAHRDALKASPLDGPAFGSMTDSAEHRDYLARTNATYKWLPCNAVLDQTKAPSKLAWTGHPPE